MPRLILLTFLLLAAPAAAQWVQLNGPLPPVTLGLAETGGVLILGTGGADAGDVYRSADGGETWQNALLPNGGVQFAFAHGGTVFVGAYLSGLFRSTDQGQSWVPIESGVASPGAMAASGDALLLAPGVLGLGRLRRSTDGGTTWTNVGPTGGYVALTAAEGVVLAAAASALYRSTDDGITWTPTDTGLPSEATYGALTHHEGAFYVGLRTASPAGLHVYRSDDGAAWTPVSVDLPTSPALYFNALTSWEGVLFAAFGSPFTGTVYRSTNDGVNWAPHVTGLPADVVSATFLATDDALWLGTYAGPYRLDAIGGAWEYGGHGTAAISGVAALHAEGSTLLVGLTTNGGGGLGLWRTDDLGQTWAPLTNGLSNRAAIQALHREGAALFAGDYGTFPRGIYRSADGGATWTFSSAGISTSTIVYDIHGHDGALMVGAYEALYRSTDGGFSWSTIPGMSEVKALASYAGALWAGDTGGRVYRSTDDGLTWTLASAGLGGAGIEALVVSGAVLYAATHGAGVFRLDLLTPSPNGAALWTPAGLQGTFADVLLDVHGVLVAATPLEGLFTSRNGGATWTPFEEGYAGGEVYELAATANHLVAGTRGHALWTHRLRPDSAGPADGAVTETALETPGRLGLFPNPTAADRPVTLTLHLAQGGPVSVTVYDALGRRVWAAAPVLATGVHRLPISAPRLAPGVYLVRVETGETVTTTRLTVRP